MLGSVRLDWHTDLSKCLRLWITGDPLKTSGGYLILAWANLGSLIEGTLKLFLSVYLDQYRADLEGALAAGSLTKSGTPRSPEILSLQQLKRFFKKNEI